MLVLLKGLAAWPVAPSNVEMCSVLCADSHRVPRHFVENLRNDMVGRDALSLCFEIQNEPMAQGRQCRGLNVVKAHIETAFRERTDFAGKNK